MTGLLCLPGPVGLRRAAYLVRSAAARLWARAEGRSGGARCRLCRLCHEPRGCSPRLQGQEAGALHGRPGLAGQHRAGAPRVDGAQHLAGVHLRDQRHARALQTDHGVPALAAHSPLQCASPTPTLVHCASRPDCSCAPQTTCSGSYRSRSGWRSSSTGARTCPPGCRAPRGHGLA